MPNQSPQPIPRKPARPLYDAVVELEPKPKGEVPAFAYVLVKTTYAIANGRAVLTEPEPLLFDIYRDETLDPNLPKLPTGSDFWITKAATDVVIQGSAYAPKGRPVPRMEVSARIGQLTKRIAVFGRRAVTWTADGRIAIGTPDPFTEMPLAYFNAYGGLDPRVLVPEPDREEYMRLSALGLTFDHPGAYPRNLIGKGYLVSPEPMENFEMPNLEDPDDLLTRQRMVVGSPELWYKQPLPWCFDWTNPLMFPRLLYGGMDAWFPCTNDAALPEVRRQLLPNELAQRMQRTPAIGIEYYQEASLGMVVRQPLAGREVVLSGMHPEESVVSFTIPADPAIEIEIEGRRMPVKPRITNLVVRPAEKKFYTVHFARTADLPRSFIPEIHKDIPLAARIANDVPVKYQCPPTVRDRLAAATQSRV
jgi:hypothetical protein